MRAKWGGWRERERGRGRDGGEGERGIEGGKETGGGGRRVEQGAQQEETGDLGEVNGGVGERRMRRVERTAGGQEVRSTETKRSVDSRMTDLPPMLPSNTSLPMDYQQARKDTSCTNPDTLTHSCHTDWSHCH